MGTSTPDIKRGLAGVIADATAVSMVIGFGHRVYKQGDSRVPTMQSALVALASGRDAAELMELYERLARAMLETKGIHPNLDYPTGQGAHTIP